jgi:dienelactone hydrolase
MSIRHRLPHHCRNRAAIVLAAVLALPTAPTTTSTARPTAWHSASRPPEALARGASALPAAWAAAGLPYAEPGPHEAGWRRVQVAPGAGPAFAALVHYPALAAGEGAALDRAGAPYPAVAFGHGFFQEPLRYAGLLEHLASWGLVVISTESQAGLAPDHAQFAADLSATLTYLEGANADGGSWLQDALRIDRFGASGHSMGGGASILATAADRRIRALANLAAAETRPSALAAMAQVSVPVQLIVGSEDGIVAPADTQKLYEAARPPQLFSTIVGGSHCGFQTNPFPIGCDRGSLPVAEQLALTRQLLTAFFRFYLADSGDWEAVWGGPPGGDPRLRQTGEPGAVPTATGAAPTATSTAPGTPTATGDPATATAAPPTATPAATAPATAAPSASAPPSATPAATGTAAPRGSAWLPWLARGAAGAVGR